MSNQHEAAPYLSVVAASRNDDHGGSLLRRMQTFVNAFIAQCRRHGLSAELILVEWNPPADRPRLAEALCWPRDLGPCRVRIIEVPAELHQRYQHAAALPLYQMIAKNVGIRRARGKFVLASNIDILLNDELMRFLAENQLDPGRMYRVDRYDAMADVPVDASPGEQLAYCQTHLLRVNAREGTLQLTPTGEFVDQQAPRGISFGRGWYPREQRLGTGFRWAYNEADVALSCAPGENWILKMDLAPGPSAGPEGVVLDISDQEYGALGTVTVPRRMMLQVALPASRSEERMLRFSVRGGGHAVPGDTRILNFRVFQGELVRESGTMPAPSIQLHPLPTSAVLRNQSERVGRLWTALRHSEGEMRVGMSVPAFLQRRRVRIDGSGLSIVLNSKRSALQSRGNRAKAADYLHSNACGDFTMMAREHWVDLRGYPEFDLYSFNIDTIFCYAAHYAGVKEQILAEPLRIYHIEHGAGSGWTPEGQQTLFDRLSAQGIPFVGAPEVAGWAAQMARLGCPMIFNKDDWGLGNFELRETTLPETVSTAP